MNFAHIHLLLNHLPVIGIGFAFLVLAWGIIRKNEEIVRTALILFVVVAALTIPTYLTGDPAGDVLTGMGVPEAAIERHDDAAGITLAAIEVLGVTALLGFIFFRRRERTPHWFLSVTLVLCFVAGGLAAWTANLGGQIRHPEATMGTPVPPPPPHLHTE